MSFSGTAPAVCALAACYFHVHVKICTENVLLVNILHLLSLTAEDGWYCHVIIHSNLSYFLCCIPHCFIVVCTPINNDIAK